ncbi:MAG: thioredoxin family protein [Phycisphaerales bacterium]
MSVTPAKQSPALPLLLVFLLLAMILLVPRFVQGSVPLPPVFADSSTLDDAIEQGKQTGKPVLALVTSDACLACTRLERDTLPDGRVTSLIADRFIPVVINEREAPDDARRLPYMYLPATLVIRDGVVVARHEGYLPAEAYTAWLEHAADDAPESRNASAAP